PFVFQLNSGASGSIIKGFVINHFTDSGIVIRGNNNFVLDCWVGLNFDGSREATFGINGILLEGEASGNVIGLGDAANRNVLSGRQFGVKVSGSTGNVMAANEILGNFIGTNPAGTAAISNRTGVFLGLGATNSAVSGNVISGNVEFGVILTTSSSTG